MHKTPEKFFHALLWFIIFSSSLFGFSVISVRNSIIIIMMMTIIIIISSFLVFTMSVQYLLFSAKLCVVHCWEIQTQSIKDFYVKSCRDWVSSNFEFWKWVGWNDKTVIYQNEQICFSNIIHFHKICQLWIC